MSTTRRATNSARQPGNRRHLTAADVPHLAAFLDGYLHQDFLLDYRTPTDALRAFLSACRAEERAGFEQDRQAFVAAIHDLPWRDIRHVFRGLGGAWGPRSRAELEALFATGPTSR